MDRVNATVSLANLAPGQSFALTGGTVLLEDGSQSVSEALHQNSLAHPARSMDNERKRNFTGEGRNVAKNIALNDYLNLGECVGRGIKLILVLHIQLS